MIIHKCNFHLKLIELYNFLHSLLNDTTLNERKGYKMNDLYFTAKSKKGLERTKYPGKPHKFNEILLCRMKSEGTRMKSSVCHLR